jgi:glyoxylase-like metal-dependent hydrolase (beta-lactamase superfamily II)
MIAAMADEDRLPEGVTRVRAPNPSPLTLDGTNAYVVERWVVDPGPADDGHLEALVDAAGGAVEGIVLTHDHIDHAEGAGPLAERTGAGVVRPDGGDRVGPFEAIATPGHSPDHVALLAGRLLFSGDTVLGAGSVFIAPGEGSLAAYLESLRRLRSLALDAILPGHGPVVWSPHAKLDDYIEHRLMRERLVLDALSAGARTSDELIDRAWSDVDLDSVPYLRYAAAATLEAHLEKLDEEGRLPEGVERGLG